MSTYTGRNRTCPGSMLVIGEYSAVVRRAFAKRGWDAWSVDLLPSEVPGNHIQGDGLVAERTRDWGLVIAHPPCTYLCNSGVRWLAPGGKLNAERHRLMQKAADFFAECYWSEADRVAVENPVMHGYAADYLASAWKVPRFSQSIQPWQFGHGEVKRTCLWLRRLPCLVPTDVIAPDFGKYPRTVQRSQKTGEAVQGRGSGYDNRVHRMAPGVNRWRERSRTLPGIAAAMASQWTL